MKRVLSIFVLCLIFYSCKIHQHTSNSRLPRGYVKMDNVMAYPFQIIHAENVENGAGHVNRLDLIGQQDTLHMDEGYLLMVHVSSKFYESFGSQELVIKELVTDEFEKFNQDSWFRPDIAQLYGTTSVFNPRGSVQDGTYYDLTYYLQDSRENKFQILKDEDYCLWWYDSREKKSAINYAITIRNIFDEVLDTLKVNDDHVALQLSNYEDNHGDLYIVEVHDLKDPEINARAIALEEVAKINIYIPNACQASSSLQALEIAYFLENNEIENRDIVLEYYEMAAKLSDHTIYHELLELYKKR